ncbi:LutB/LldF family L-lactate oxidation iron-sulfur protein [Zavarzinia sp. CC-PAN008]|uniref:LutB/LldF family L-lactate oxidation iron-sulfur protein n=1 Tax=Zavarzinia sp. CC-PAN008 TaxID=3243332 RepID=UPI003F74832C
MTHAFRPEAFKEQATTALGDAPLQRALHRLETGFGTNRRRALEALPEFEDLKAAAQALKNHTLAHLDTYLEQFETNVLARGGQVHWCETGADACAAVIDICRKAGARTVTKGKSMATEEIGLNAALEQAGLEPIETDLGEYIIQLAHEPPSHIIGPAIHKTREQVEALFRAEHPTLPPTRDLAQPEQLVAEARAMLRQRFLAADVGITGANFMIAETGSTVIVTNEGNGDLTQTLPRVHIVVVGIEKVIPRLADLPVFLRLLGRSATGQEMSVYTTVSTGPRRAEDPDGPEQFHVVLLDNGRSGLLGGAFQDMLRCIRCGACMNHCPVYGAVGGHAYGHVYMGPMGAVLAPLFAGLEVTRDLPNASTFCGRCAEVCPVGIPLPDLMRRWRNSDFERGLAPARDRWATRLWAYAARRPRLYRALTWAAAKSLKGLARGRGKLAVAPLASGWTASRDLPAPEGETFMARWKRERPQ